ncbi:MAG: hypothetical protein ACJAWW_001224, partial [Sulfurimonas sp.]
ATKINNQQSANLTIYSYNLTWHIKIKKIAK